MERFRRGKSRDSIEIVEIFFILVRGIFGNCWRCRFNSFLQRLLFLYLALVFFNLYLNGCRTFSVGSTVPGSLVYARTRGMSHDAFWCRHWDKYRSNVASTNFSAGGSSFWPWNFSLVIGSKFSILDIPCWALLWNDRDFVQWN